MAFNKDSLTNKITMEIWILIYVFRSSVSTASSDCSLHFRQCNFFCCLLVGCWFLRVGVSTFMQLLLLWDALYKPQQRPKTIGTAPIYLDMDYKRWKLLDRLMYGFAGFFFLFLFNLISFSVHSVCQYFLFWFSFSSAFLFICAVKFMRRGAWRSPLTSKKVMHIFVIIMIIYLRFEPSVFLFYFFPTTFHRTVLSFIWK